MSKTRLVRETWRSRKKRKRQPVSEATVIAHGELLGLWWPQRLAGSTWTFGSPRTGKSHVSYNYAVQCQNQPPPTVATPEED